MANESAVLLIIIIVIIIIIISASRRSSSRHIQRASDLEVRGQYLDALDLYSRYSSLEDAAAMVLRTPEASQILALRWLEKRYHSQRLEKVFMRLARVSLARDDPHTAANAFVLAKKPFAAAKVYIDKGGLEYVPTAIQVLDQNSSLIHNRDQAIRNLARYAYNGRKFMEAAELLRTIGAEDEANTVLVAAASELRKKGDETAAQQVLSSTARPKLALQHYLKEINENIQEGNIENARRSLAVAKNIAEDQPDEEKLVSLNEEIAEYDRLLKILDSARDILRKKNMNQAIALYDELVEGLGDGVPAAILAEAALANEEKNPQYSAKLYLQASERVKSSQAANTFRTRAQTLTNKIDDKVTPPIKPTTATLDEVEEYCSVCRKEMTDLSSLVRCPECGSPAHYAHLAEWLKIRGVCPICKNKIKLIKPK